MQELKILSESYNTIILCWNKSDTADEYLIEGLTNIFTYEPIDVVKKCSYVYKKNPKYVGYRVCYTAKHNRTSYTIDTTNIVRPQKYNDNLAKITIVPVKSVYGKISLTFKSEEIFDWYKLYDDKGNLVAETEDWIVLGDYYSKKYYVEGYKKTKDGCILEGLSDITSTKKLSKISPEKTTLSIVIPAYNCASFLPRTIQAVLSSTFTNFEIILVNDGSGQETVDVCNWYADNFDFIKIIHQENKGVCIARNNGEKNAKGEWIAFLDSDDVVHPYMYEKLYKEAVKNETDIAISQCLTRNDHEKSDYVLAKQSNQPTIIMNSFKEIMDERNSAKNNIYFCAVWNKIVKTDIVRKVKFDENLRYYDDIGYTTALYTYINKFLFVKDALYLWDKRKRGTEGTLSTTYSGIPSEVIWENYVVAYAEPLFIGNPDPEVAKTYKYDILKHLLEKYKECNASPNIIKIIGGYLKYLNREFNLPIEELNNTTNKELYTLWTEIAQSNISEFHGLKKESE